jgi:glucosamine-6-phosphate deaminase
VARAAADLLAEEVAAQREIVLALPTGRTPIPFYDELAARHAAGRLDLTRARGFNLDEIGACPARSAHVPRVHGAARLGTDGPAPRPLRHPRRRRARPRGGVRRYERAITDAGGIGVAILGVGVDGHIAYNMPDP